MKPLPVPLLLVSALLGALPSGCAPRVGAGPDQTSAVDTSPDDSPAETGASPPRLAQQELDAIGHALESFAWWVPRLSMDPVRAAADRGDAVQLPPCPTLFLLNDGTRFWQDDCNTARGAHFFGGLARQRGSPMTLDDDEHIADLAETWGPGLLEGYVAGSATAAAQPGERVNGLCRVDLASGAHIAIDGDFLRLDLQVPGAMGTAGAAILRATLRKFGGPVVDTFASPDEANWVHHGLRPELLIREVSGASPDHLVRSIHGALTPLDGAYDTVQASQVAVLGPAIAGCSREPSGTLSARDPDGVWYDVAFDAPAPDPAITTADEGCDGCGTVYLLGEPVGQVCPDLSALWLVPGPTASAP